MRRRSPRLAWASLALVLPMLAAGCNDEDEGRTEAELAEGDPIRLGRIHVVLEPSDEPERADTTEDGSQLEVTARFAYVRGLDEEFVRTRIDMPVLPSDVLRGSGQCVPSDYLAALDVDGDAADGEARELVLVDAGDLAVQLGDNRVQVPLSLVRDLLPYTSGVEYIYYDEGTPLEASGEVQVEAEGSQTDELPPFTVEGQVPPAIELEVAEVFDRSDVLALQWQPGQAGAEGSLTVRVTATVGSEAFGSEITCVFDDGGRGELDLAALRAMGLPSSDTLQVEASRVHRSMFDAGDFVGSELLIELRDRTSVAM